MPKIRIEHAKRHRVDSQADHADVNIVGPVVGEVLQYDVALDIVNGLVATGSISPPPGAAQWEVMQVNAAINFITALIVNANIDPAAAIAYGKLNLANSIVNADINVAAAIAWAKISKVGANLTDLPTRNHNDLQNRNVADVHPHNCLEAVGNHDIVYKTADESVLASAVLQNDDHLFFSMTANGVYQFEFVIFHNHHLTPDIQLTINAAAAATNVRAHVEDIFVGINFNIHGTAINAYGVVHGVNYTGTGDGSCIVVRGVVENGGTDTVLYLQWAQRLVSGVVATTVYRGSYVKWWRIS